MLDEKNEKLQIEKTSKGKISDFEDQNEEVNLEKTLEIVGNNGYYQKFIFLAFCFISLTLGINFMAVPFFFFQPTFYCYDSDHRLEKCSQKLWCENKFGREMISEKISLIQTFAIYCENADTEKWAKSFLFFWVGLTVVSFSVISDKIGRRQTLKIMSAWMFVASILVIFSSNFAIVWLSFSSCYACGSIFFAVSSVYYNETMSWLTRQRNERYFKRIDLHFLRTWLYFESFNLLLFRKCSKHLLYFDHFFIFMDAYFFRN